MTFYAASLVISTTLLVLALSIAAAQEVRTKATTTTTTTTKSTSLRTPVKTQSSRFSFSDVVGRGGTTTGGGAGSGPTDRASSGGGGTGDCNFDTQNCDEGKKCTVENIWNDTPRCRWIVNNYDAVGDECSTLHDNDGDTCDADGICLEEKCRAVDTDDTSCTNEEISREYPSGVRLCEKTCDPLIQSDCANDSHCTVPDGSLDSVFSCQVTSGPLAPPQAGCSQSCDCKQGNVCRPSGNTSYCNNGADKCCVPLCDLGDDIDYCNGNASCTPFYPLPVAGYEHVGVCVYLQNP